MPKARLLIIGMGQDLRGDDAVGLEVVKRWKSQNPEIAKKPEVVVEMAPLPGLSLLSFLECVEAAILVDAVHSGAVPGRLHILDREDLASFGGDARSAHGWGVAETLMLGQDLYGEKMPKEICLLAVEAGSMELGRPLSAAVLAALPAAVLKLQELALQILEPVPSTLLG
jgi:hydrogenase maturation protease